MSRTMSDMRLPMSDMGETMSDICGAICITHKSLFCYERF